MKTTSRYPGIVESLTILACLASRASAQVVADAGPDQAVTVETGCEATVALDGTGSQVEPGAEATYTWTGPFTEGDGTVVGAKVIVTLRVGVHSIVLSVASEGVTSTDSLEVQVKETTPPTISSVSASPDVLWPPDHGMVEVKVHVSVSDDCDDAPACEIYRIDSDEPENDRGDGNTAPDSRITGKLSADLRAERSGRGDGRVYTIRVQCTDSSGNVSRSKTHVSVPHDRGGGRGGGEGSADRCKLRVSFERVEKNRMVARLDISAAEGGIPENGTAPRADDLEGYELSLSVAGLDFGAVVSERGVAVGDGMVARWRPAQGVVLVDIRGADLPEGLGLDPDTRGRRIPVSVPVLLKVQSREDGAEPIILFDDDLSSSYKGKAPRHGGSRP